MDESHNGLPEGISQQENQLRVVNKGANNGTGRPWFKIHQLLPKPKIYGQES